MLWEVMKELTTRDAKERTRAEEMMRKITMIGAIVENKMIATTATTNDDGNDNSNDYDNHDNKKAKLLLQE